MDYGCCSAGRIPYPDHASLSFSFLLSHAFYLAIEGGRNATSGVTVQGVGAANRAQIERAFFRAMTLIMPNVSMMPVAAQATVQAAVDLYGASSAPANAIRQAMQAVGLVAAITNSQLPTPGNPW